MPKTALPALDGHDRRACRDDVELERVPKTKPDTVVDLQAARVRLADHKRFQLITYVRLPLVRLNAARLGVPEGIDTSVEVDLARGLLVAGDCNAGTVN